jgi:hypothetical protein
MLGLCCHAEIKNRSECNTAEQLQRVAATARKLVVTLRCDPSSSQEKYTLLLLASANVITAHIESCQIDPQIVSIVRVCPSTSDPLEHATTLSRLRANLEKCRLKITTSCQLQSAASRVLTDPAHKVYSIMPRNATKSNQNVCPPAGFQLTSLEETLSSVVPHSPTPAVALNLHQTEKRNCASRRDLAPLKFQPQRLGQNYHELVWVMVYGG